MNLVHGAVLALGLSMAGAAMAGEPADTGYTEVTVAGVKVGIDPKTGRLRPLTAEESAALDRALVQQQAAAAKPGQRSFARSRVSSPATPAEAVKTIRNVGGKAMAMKLPLSEMSTLVVRTDASGGIVVAHEGEEAGQNGELADE